MVQESHSVAKCDRLDLNAARSSIKGMDAMIVRSPSMPISDAAWSDIGEASSLYTRDVIARVPHLGPVLQYVVASGRRLEEIVDIQCLKVDHRLTGRQMDGSATSVLNGIRYVDTTIGKTFLADGKGLSNPAADAAVAATSWVVGMVAMAAGCVASITAVPFYLCHGSDPSRVLRNIGFPAMVSGAAIGAAIASVTSSACSASLRFNPLVARWLVEYATRVRGVENGHDESDQSSVV